ncbi:MAG TPA: carboxylating nicotinate-nucleotide diphosphorylase [Candidatus Limnocylindrales bacterium]|nr:carboxylating nicotinate-nucleotide diphosphorylase [Candidatus Limnocylindrales bacterium]
MRALADDERLRRLLRLALEEDVGSGDITTRLTVPEGTRARGRVIARERMVVAGMLLFAPLREELAAMGEPGHGAASLQLSDIVADGASVDAGACLCVIDGEAAGILTIERTFLNFLGQLSGIATETARVVSMVREAGCSTRILDTRKTTPGHRRLEKYAVACGGGSNHRMGLFDAVLIKDNHVVAAGGIDKAVRAALAGAPANMDVEAECDTLDQVRAALDAGARAVLLDNFTPAQVAEAVRLIAGRARIEVSGGVTLQTVVEYAQAGPDAISMGRLTHSARSADVSMEVTLLV